MEIILKDEIIYLHHLQETYEVKAPPTSGPATIPSCETITRQWLPFCILEDEILTSHQKPHES